ncbi:MAG: oligosaccharide flippase family protein, partial [Lachnospiraceae bacterium]|nr:oligosaccharide flippase family protein [Lachnospiraceae bacterium]
MNKVERKSHKVDMCNGSVFRKMLIFAIPLMCSSMLQLLFNAADVVVVGRYAGDNALAAVGSNGPIINLITNLFIGMSIGTNVLTAQYFGGKKYKDLEETIHTSVMLSIISGIFLTILGIVVAKPILQLMQAPEEVLDLAV